MPLCEQLWARASTPQLCLSASLVLKHSSARCCAPTADPAAHLVVHDATELLLALSMRARVHPGLSLPIFPSPRLQIRAATW